jgi:hypothetical protein
MSLHFNIRADLTLSYFVIFFFNYLQDLHVLPSSIHFVIFKNLFLLNHEDPCDMPHTTGNNIMYTIHSWVLYMHVHCPSCPNTFINLAVQNPWLGLTSMTTTNLPTISSFVIDGNTHVPPIIMIQISLPLWHQWQRLGLLPLSLMEKCNSLLWGCSPWTCGTQ